MSKRYNHMVDIAFTVITEHENFEDIPISELIAGLSQRLANVLAQEACDPNSSEEVFGHCDVFEEEPTKLLTAHLAI